MHTLAAVEIDLTQIILAIIALVGAVLSPIVLWKVGQLKAQADLDRQTLLERQKDVDAKQAHLTTLVNSMSEKLLAKSEAAAAAEGQIKGVTDERLRVALAAVGAEGQIKSMVDERAQAAAIPAPPLAPPVPASRPANTQEHFPS